MKIIFLDIDGVLNVIPEDHDQFGGTFHKNFVENLRAIVEKTGAKIVITSTWRHGGRQTMKDMWQYRDLPGEMFDITPYLGHDVQRGEEIKHWLAIHPDVDGYVIIDDDRDMLLDQLHHFVWTFNNIDHSDFVDMGYGLTKECTNKAILILTKYKYEH